MTQIVLVPIFRKALAVLVIWLGDLRNLRRHVAYNSCETVGQLAVGTLLALGVLTTALEVVSFGQQHLLVQV